MFPDTQRRCRLALVVVVVCGTQVARSESRYELVDLGVIYSGANSQSVAKGINDEGFVTGFSTATFGGQVHAFLWANGVMFDLGGLGAAESRGEAINESLHIAGRSSDAFLWQNGTVFHLGTLGGDFSWAEDLNDLDQVVGRSTNAAGHMRAFCWQDGVMSDLGTLGGETSYATGINAAGQVVGYADRFPGADIIGHRAFLWEDGVMTELGSLGGESFAQGINDLGQVVGGAEIAGDFKHAFYWTETEGMVALPELGGRESEALAINNAGAIVGYAAVAGTEELHAAIWQDGTVADLNDFVPHSWKLQFAYDINEHGWIVGSGLNPEGQVRGFLLVPEPSSIALLIAAALAAHAKLVRRSGGRARASWRALGVLCELSATCQGAAGSLRSCSRNRGARLSG